MSIHLNTNSSRFPAHFIYMPDPWQKLALKAPFYNNARITGQHRAQVHVFSHPPRTCVHFASIEYTGGIIKNTSGTRECWRINKTFNWQKGAPTGVPVYYTHSSSRSPTFCSFSPSLSLSREKHTQNLERKHTHTDTIPDSFAQSRFSSCE